jgi:chromosome segregation protein
MRTCRGPFPGLPSVRLTKLKLSGFKSFVDPTTVLFPGQLVGVVGPNGCGKSNVIDAVRWVLGESKASELRGESMQDVIFNGSGQRKPVGRASVELFFDNALGRAAGQWSQYAEIAVKRTLDREGNSSYYINNLHVRRRDVIDVFLGTGLGPRAYAIIGQGMISRIIEAKPEDLRMFLEEAAGVSKYKERRKETENRLADARENLLRVDDIRNELDGQIGRLETQAEVARKYHDLQHQLVRRQNLLWLKKRNAARADAERLAREVDAGSTKLEAETAQLREFEARIEHAREAHFAASDSLHAAQAEMYAAKAEVGRIESEIAHMREARQRLETRLAQLGVEETHWRQQQNDLEQERIRWLALQENVKSRVGGSDARHAEAQERLPAAEESVHAAGAALTEARHSHNEAEQGARLAEADRAHAARALENLAQRRRRLEEERGALPQPQTEQLAAARAAAALAEERLAEAQERLATLQGSVPEMEGQLRTARERLQTSHRQLTETRARRDALEQLQRRVRQNGEIGDWLQRHGLTAAMPLWQSIEVEAGWETAVEAVLRERLAAVAVDAPQAARALAEPPPITFALALAGTADAAASGRGGSLRAKVRCAEPVLAAVLDEWLDGVHAAEDLAPLLGQRGRLNGDLHVNRAGNLLSAHGLVLYVPDVRTHGVLERQREIGELDAAVQRQEEDEALAREAQGHAEQRLGEQQEQLVAARRAVQELQQQSHAAQVEALKLAQLQSRFEERAAQIAHDLGEIERGEQNERDELTKADAEAARCAGALEASRQRVEHALEVQRAADVGLREARALEHQLAREAQEARFSERECAGRLEDNGRAMETAASQLQRVTAETETARAEAAGISDTVLQEQLQSALGGRDQREAGLAERRDALEAAATTLRALDEERLRIEHGLTPLRERINELRLKQQAAQLNEEQFVQRLTEANADETDLAAELVPGLRESVLAGDITRLGQEIEALGPVNLAALEELNTSRERKGFLDAQSGDLAEAIGTLEDAIRRIDRETREQLQATYDQVNHQFGIIFPQLFGGGEAKLILTGDEILDAGIQVMAQPPGKKNSTIHLLSGGEKALTALALVFALFQLNPAPFCLLDEVDAPLDDSNTDRFCELVKRMSAQTQFLFITHNKIAMEMAQQLIGVTMQEQGVSRVVEVDIDEALRLTEEMAA